MKVIVDGMKNNNVRFTCECCSCVFEANKNDDGFSVIGEKREMKCFDSDDFQVDPVTRYKARMFDEYCMTETKSICTCPSCGSIAFGKSIHWEYVGKKTYRLI